FFLLHPVAAKSEVADALAKGRTIHAAFVLDVDHAIVVGCRVVVFLCGLPLLVPIEFGCDNVAVRGKRSIPTWYDTDLPCAARRRSPSVKTVTGSDDGIRTGKPPRAKSDLSGIIRDLQMAHAAPRCDRRVGNHHAIIDSDDVLWLAGCRHPWRAERRGRYGKE